MITIFSTTKPFKKEFNHIQHNAIQSWLLLHPDIEVILFGEEDGMAEAASKYGLRQITDIKVNENGMPLVRDLFVQAQTLARHNVLCYVNADIILTSGFLEALKHIIHKPLFLMIGQRWDVEIANHIDFCDTDWEQKLIDYAMDNGKLHFHTGIDYFLFPKGLYDEMPPIAIARSAWDQWLVYKARSKRAPVFDATRIATIIHQDHSYSITSEDPECIQNREKASMVGNKFHPFTVYDATHILDESGVKPALALRYLWRRLMATTVINNYLHPTYKLIKGIRDWVEIYFSY